MYAWRWVQHDCLRFRWFSKWFCPENPPAGTRDKVENPLHFDSCWLLWSQSNQLISLTHTDGRESRSSVLIWGKYVIGWNKWGRSHEAFLSCWRSKDKQLVVMTKCTEEQESVFLPRNTPEEGIMNQHMLCSGLSSVKTPLTAKSCFIVNLKIKWSKLNNLKCEVK